jgi:Mini-chromosome maintenance protein 2
VSNSHAERLARLAAERQSQRQVLTSTVFPGDDAYNASDIVGVRPIRHPNDEDKDKDYSEDNDIDYDVQDEVDNEDEEEEGGDLLENAEQDYQRIDALDTYGTEGINDTEYDRIAEDQRRAAEKELAWRVLLSCSSHQTPY